MIYVWLNEQLELEDAQRLANRRWEQELGRREATEDMSEDLSEGEKGDVVGELTQSETPKKKLQRNFSDLPVWSDDNKEKKIYIVLIRYTFSLYSVASYVHYWSICLEELQMALLHIRIELEFSFETWVCLPFVLIGWRHVLFIC